MPKKKSNNVLPKYVAAIRKNGAVTGYKYQRRVPQKAQDMALKVGTNPLPPKLDIYLSADLTHATAMAAKLASIHDEQFTQLITPRGMFAANVAEKTDAIRNPPQDEPVPVGGEWQDWQNILARFGVDSPAFRDDAKADFLAACLASAFGERHLIEEISAPYARALGRFILV